MFRSGRMLVFSLILLSTTGCSLLEWVAPHQLYKLNRQPAMGREDAYFSIPAESHETLSRKRTDTN